MIVPGKIACPARLALRIERTEQIAQRPIGDKARFRENEIVAVGGWISRIWTRTQSSVTVKNAADEAQRPQGGQHADRDQKQQRGAHGIDPLLTRHGAARYPPEPLEKC